MKKDEKLLAEINDRMQTAVSFWSDNVTNARDDIAYLNNDQWPQKERKEREAEGRPCLTFDKLNQSVKQVYNDQKQQNAAIKIRPVEADNDKIQNYAGTKDYTKAQVFEGIIRNIEYCSSASVAYQTAGKHAAQSGFGFFRICTDYASDDVFEQDIRIKRVQNQFSCYPGPFTELDGSDMEYGFFTDKLSKDEYKAKYPKAQEPGEFSIKQSGDQYWVDGDFVVVAEYFRRVPVTKTLLKMNTGEVIEKTAEVEKVIDEMAQAGLVVESERKVKTYKVEWYKATSAEILEGPTEFASKFIPIIPVLGEEIVVDGKPNYRSVIRTAKDAQQAYNVSRTAQIESDSLAPKAPFIIGISQLKGGLDKYWKMANKKLMAYLPYEDKENSSTPQRSQGVMIQAGLVQSSMQAADDIKSATGIYDASLGTRSNETSGKAILARQREGDVSTYEYQDNLSVSIQHCGRILLDMIPRIYDSTRLVRLKFPDDTEDFVEINKTIRDAQTGEDVVIHDMSYGKYDATVTVGASYSTQRVEAAEAMFNALNMNPSLWTVIGDLAIGNTDWPGADKMAERLRKTINPSLLDATSEESQQAQQQAQTPTVEQQLQQGAIQAEMGKNQASMAKADADTAKAEAIKMQAQADAMKAQVEMAQLQSQMMNMQGAIQNLTGLIQQMAMSQQPQMQQQQAFLMPENQA